MLWEGRQSVVLQADSSRLPSSPRTGALAVTGDTSQAYSSPRRKARSTPRYLSERQRQRRVHHKPSPDASTDEAVGEVARTPRGRRRDPRSKIPVLEKTFSTAAETAPSAVTAIPVPRTSDDSVLVRPIT